MLGSGAWVAVTIRILDALHVFQAANPAMHMGPYCDDYECNKTFLVAN